MTGLGHLQKYRYWMFLEQVVLGRSSGHRVTITFVCVGSECLSMLTEPTEEAQIIENIHSGCERKVSESTLYHLCP